MSVGQSADAMSDLVRFLIVLALLGIVVAMVFYVAGWIPVPAMRSSPPSAST
jgi:phage shock protein PspC (stress-responsive transcriptional regulator)